VHAQFDPRAVGRVARCVLDELAEHGTINGEKLDSFEVLSRDELKLKLRTLQKQLTEAKDEQKKLQLDAQAAVEQKREWMERAVEATSGPAQARLTKAQEDVLRQLDAHQKLIERDCRLLESISFDEAGDDVTAKALAFAHWMLFRVERSFLYCQQKAVDASWGVAAPTGEDWGRNESRKKEFEKMVPVTPI